MDALPAEPFAVTQLADLGLSRYRLRQLIHAGAVRRVLRGAFVRADLDDTVELRAAAVALVMPPHTVVCDRSAAWLHDVECLEPTEDPALRALEVVAIGANDRTRRPQMYGGRRALMTEDLCTVSGVRATTPARTAADLARLRGRRSALAVLDAFARQHGVGPADHSRLIERLAGHRGVVQYRELATLADPRAESPGESWTRLEIIDHGLPAPTPQVWVDLPGFGRVRLDLAYPHWRIAVEYDGEEFHTSPQARVYDERRRQALRDAGWVVLVVRKGDFRPGCDGQWVADLTVAIGDRRTRQRRVYARSERSGPVGRW